MSSPVRRRLRYATPVVVAGVVGLAASIPSLSAGATTPDLPAITAQQLITKVGQADVTSLQGTVTVTANLGLPSLSGLTSDGGQQVSGSSGLDPTSLLSGSHQIEVWTDGDQQRLALPSTMAETDVVRTGNQLWLYDSGTQHVTHYVVDPPAGSAGTPATTPTDWTGTPLTPEQVAAKILGALTPSTLISAAAGPDVAGQHEYLLTLSPKPGTPQAADSTLGQVAIAIDATNGLPLQVSVYGTSSSTTPVFQLGYSSVSFTTPAASNFTAPVGTSTTTKVLHPGSAGSGHGVPSAGGAAAPAGAGGVPARPRPTVTGPAWAQVASFSAPELATAKELQSVTTAVSGSFGTARLLHTALVNALILPDGRVLVGFVTPAVLESDAANAPLTGASTPAAG
jgi:outer membrane lipoprotein-sorting protein